MKTLHYLLTLMSFKFCVTLFYLCNEKRCNHVLIAIFRAIRMIVAFRASKKSSEMFHFVLQGRKSYYF